MAKIYSDGKSLQESILNGVNKLADNVASTLGPRGRNVIIHVKGKNPIVTKDGVTVAKFVDFEDEFENVGAQIIKQVASETNNLAGDGTTTSTVLARGILNNTQKYIAAGASPVELKRGMDKALEEIVKKIEEISRPIQTQEEIEHVATISANGDKSIGKLISMAVDQAGHDGAISIEEAKSMETTLDVTEGFRFDSGYFANAFVNNERRGAVEHDGAYILVTDYKLDTVQEILPALELVARESKPFVIIAEEVEGQALAALIMNAMRGTMKVAAVKAPRYGQERHNILKDLALAVGATFVSRESGKKLSDIKLTDLGECKKIEVLKYSTTIVGGNSDWEEIDKRVESLKEEIRQIDDIAECERIQERITRLISGVAIIKVGAATEVEMLEKKYRVEDALEAVKSALEEGIVPGGGVVLARCKDFKVEVDNEDQKYGAEIIRKSLESPIRQMALNADESPDLILSLVENEMGNCGWDYISNKMVDMIESGITDPAKVTRVALQNAVSAASILITTGHAIVEV